MNAMEKVKLGNGREWLDESLWDGIGRLITLNDDEKPAMHSRWRAEEQNVLRWEPAWWPREPTEGPRGWSAGARRGAYGSKWGRITMFGEVFEFLSPGFEFSSCSITTQLFTAKAFSNGQRKKSASLFDTQARFPICKTSNMQKKNEVGSQAIQNDHFAGSVEFLFPPEKQLL